MVSSPILGQFWPNNWALLSKNAFILPDFTVIHHQRLYVITILLALSILNLNFAISKF